VFTLLEYGDEEYLELATCLFVDNFIYKRTIELFVVMCRMVPQWVPD